MTEPKFPKHPGLAAHHLLSLSRIFVEGHLVAGSIAEEA
jgi:hypothetical protein